MNYSRRSFLRSLGMGISFSILPAPFSCHSNTKPNIVFIMSDDHAAQAIGAYGSKINKTPNIDRIGREGILFNNCFCTNSICAPSRAVILTGKYSHLNGVLDNGQQFDGNQQTFPNFYSEPGTRQPLSGNGIYRASPRDLIFGTSYRDRDCLFDPNMIKKEGPVKYEGYVTDIITEQALDWLEKRQQDKPFCLMIQHKAPHANWEFSEKYADWFTEAAIPEPETFHDDYQTRSQHIKNSKLKVGRNQWQLHYRFGDIPDDVKEEDVKALVYQRYIKDYLRCIASLDENVGGVFDLIWIHPA